MIKKLLLLGLLRGQKLHGYGLVEYLQNHTMGGASIGKSNAYRLLKEMERDGLIRSVTEREGNLPERHVYEVTSNGEAFFADALLKELSKDATADQPGIAVLNYLHELDPATAADQLQYRRDQVAAREAELANVPDEVRHLHPALDLSLYAYFSDLMAAIALNDLWHGLFKSMLFAVLVAIVSSLNGAMAQGGAEGVGRMTTRAVVQSIAAIIIADMLFAYLATLG